MLDDSSQPTPEAPLPTNDLTSEKELKDKNFLLEQKVKRLEQELERYKGRIQVEDTIAKEVGWLGWNVFKRFFLGSQLFEKTQKLWNTYSTWVKTGEREQLEPATRDFAAALLVRLLRLSKFGLVLAVIPTIFVITQTFLLYFQNQKIDRQNDLVGTQNALLRQQNDLVLNQNEKFDVQNELVRQQTTLLAQQNDLAEKQEKLLEEQNDLFANQNNSLLSQNELIANQSKQIDVQNDLVKAQNEKVDRQVATQVYDQTIKLRELLRLPPLDKDNNFIKDYPYTNTEVDVWPSPNLSAVKQIIIFGEKETEVAISSLKALLIDNEPPIAAGALLVIQSLINHKNKEISLLARRSLHPNLKPEEFIFGLPVNLKRIKRLDLSNMDLSEANLNSCDLSHERFLKGQEKLINITPGHVTDTLVLEIGMDGQTSARHLSTSILKFTRLNNASIEFADLQYVDLTGASLKEASLVGALLSHADLTGADLRGADLLGANLEETKLRGTNLIGTNLQIAFVGYKNGAQIFITAEYLKSKGAIFDETTKFSISSDNK
jgi:hypothetical protein